MVNIKIERVPELSESVKHYLDGNWELKFTMPEENRVIKTKTPVPGNIEPTLKKLGLIEDYIPADDEFATSKFEVS